MASEKSSSILIIAGMHRSGTSLTASILQSGGLHIGRKLLDQSHGASERHFENLDFFEFHKAVLRSQGVNEDGWTLQETIEVEDRFVEQAKELVAKNAVSSVWGWKEPRTTLFLEFWANLLPEAKFLLLYRFPWEVLDSLYRRGDKIFKSQPDLAVKIWQHYNKKLLSLYNKYSERCFLVDLHVLLNHLDTVTSAMNQKLHLNLTTPSSTLYKPSQIHKQSIEGHRASLIAHYFPEAIEMYRELEARAWQVDDTPDLSWVDQLNNSPYRTWVFQDWLQLGNWEGEKSKLQQELENSRSQLQQTQAELEQSRSQLQQTQGELESSHSQLQQTQKELEDSFSRYQQTQAELEQSRTQLQQTQAELEQSRTQLQQTQAGLEEYRTQLNRTETTLEQSVSQLNEVGTLLEQYSSQLCDTQEELEFNKKQLYNSEEEHKKTQAELNQVREKLKQSRSELYQVTGEVEQAKSDLSLTKIALDQSDLKQEKLKRLLPQLHKVQSELDQSQLQLYTTQNLLEQSKAQVFQQEERFQAQLSHTEKYFQAQAYQTEERLQESQDQLTQVKAELEEYKSQLYQAKREHKQTQALLLQTQGELEHSQSQLALIQDSSEQLQYEKVIAEDKELENYTDYKLLVWKAWSAYQKSDLAGMVQYLRQSWKCKPYSRSETVINWLESFAYFSSEKKVPFDSESLTNLDEWKQLIRQTVMVKMRASKISGE